MRWPRLGKLRHRLRIEAPTQSAGEGGGATLAWETIANVWAEILPASGREVFISDGISARVTHEVRLRYRADLVPAMRFIASGQTLDIRVVRDIDGRGLWLSCLCEETLP